MREVIPGLESGRDYTILSTIREGRLFLGERAGKRFVLKTAGVTAKAQELLKREYELSIGLSHPSLAYVFTYEEESPVGPCIVQEYVDGPTLAEWLSGNPPADERKRVFGELLSVVAYLHEKGIVHNDLTPANILVSRSGGTLKLIDLGFADSDAYYEHAIGGTRSYASPELLKGGRTDASSDVYSLGIILTEILPGRYGRLVRRCLQKNPSKRYPSAGVLLKAWLNHNLPWKIALALLAVLIAVILSISLMNTQRQLKVFRDAEAERVDVLSAARAEIDLWYETEVPNLFRAFADARSQAEVNSAWAVFMERMNTITIDLPNRTPESFRPAVRDYLFQRSNETFPALQDSLVQAMKRH